LRCFLGNVIAALRLHGLATAFHVRGRLGHLGGFGGCRHRQQRGTRRHRLVRTGELGLILLAARRPAALLYAEGGDRHAPGFRGQHEAHGQHAILLAALDDVAGLDEHLFRAGILDLQLVDAAGLGNLHAPLGQGFLQRERDRPAGTHTMH
jgi:hypothetical protein